MGVCFVCVDEECDHLIKVATPLMKRALVSGDAKGYTSNVRTNSVGWVGSAGDRVLEVVEDRICELFGCEPEVSLPSVVASGISVAPDTKPSAREQCTENFQCIHYDVDQEYKAHLDACVRAWILYQLFCLIISFASVDCVTATILTRHGVSAPQPRAGRG